MKSEDQDEALQSLKTLETLSLEERESGTVTLPQSGPLAQKSDYVFLSRVGSGGGGVVWQGIQVGLDRTVAIKTKRSSGSTGDPDSTLSQLNRLQFFQEAFIAARLDHPGIIPIYDIGVGKTGEPLFSMKMVRGKSWSLAIREDWSELTEEEFLERHLAILVSLMQAVAFAHSRGVVHRDLKPSQVMLGDYGEVVLLDWGLAILLHEESDPWKEAGLESPQRYPLPTRETAMSPAGTPALMAPEQTLPHSREVTERTDIYLLGGILYYLLCHEYPHAAESSQASLVKAQRGKITPPEELAPGRIMPAKLRRLALQALEPNPEKRPASVEEMLGRLRDYISGASARGESREHSAGARVALESLRDAGVQIEELPEGDFSIRMTSESPHLDRIYPGLEAARVKTEKAAASWSANPEIQLLRNRTIAAQAMTAAVSGDIRVAGHLASQLTAPTALNDVMKVVEAKERANRLQGKIRTGAIAVAVILLAALSVGAYQFGAAQREAARKLAIERDQAELARQEALDQRNAAQEAHTLAQAESYFSSIALANLLLLQGASSRTQEILLRLTDYEERGWEWGRLWAKSSMDAMTLQFAGPRNEILSGGFSADGSLMYTGDRLGTLRIWDAKSGNLKDSAKIHEDGIWDISPSEDGLFLLTTSFDQSAAIISTETYEVTQRFDHPDGLRRGAVRPGGQSIATACADGLIRMWDIASGELRWEFDTDQRVAFGVSFDETGQYLAATANDELFLLNAENGELIAGPVDVPENLLDVSFAPKGFQLITTCTDRVARLYEAPDLELIREFNNETSWLLSVEWNRSGTRFVTTDNAGAVRLWDAESGEIVREVSSKPRAFHAVLSADERHLLCSAQTLAQVWDLESEERGSGEAIYARTANRRAEPDITSQVFSSFFDPSWGKFDSTFHRNTDNGRTLFETTYFTAAVDSFYRVISPDAERMIAIDRDNLETQIVHRENGETLFEFSHKVAKACWARDGRRFATISDEGEFILYDGNSYEEIAVLGEPSPFQEESFARICGAVVFSPDSQKLFTGNRRGGAVLWSADEGRELIRFSAEKPHPIFTAAFNHDGSIVAEGGIIGEARLWDTETGALISQLKGHPDSILALDFHPDGSRLISLSHDDKVRLWEVQSGRELLTVLEQPGPNFLLAAGFSPDGKHIWAADSNVQLHVASAMDWTIQGEGEELRKMLELDKRRTRFNQEATLADIDLFPDEPRE